MKNLKKVFTAIYKLPELDGTNCFCVSTEGNVNEFNNSVSLYFYSKGIIYAFTGGKKESKEIYNINDYYNNRDGCHIKGVNIEYQYLSRSLILALVNGDVFSLELETSELQCIGSVDSGLRTMEWSPDFETVVFATGANTIILMTGSFDPIIEINLFDTGPAIQQMVNVGWGKKETQFHGSEGKAARTAVPVEGAKNIEDDTQVRVSWRGDSTLFAVSVWLDELKQREIKIFNQEGVYQCSGEPLSGLEQSISWRPSGNLIAMSQMLPNKHIINFMEKNGLVHGNFVLPPETKVRELYWNMDSTILCVVCEKKLLLYTTGNYYWYLKQQLEFPSSPIASLKWDRNIPNLLHVIQLNGTYSVHQWLWNVYRTPSLSDNDGALVAVIDGNRTLLSSFKKKTIPPPMSDHIVTFSNPVKEIAFATGEGTHQSGDAVVSQKSFTNDFVVYLCNEKIAFVTNTIEDPKTSDELPIEKLEVSFLHHFIWMSRNVLVCCGIKPGGQYYICELNVNPSSVIARRHMQLSQPLISLVPFSSTELLLQLADGQLYKYGIDGELTKMMNNVTEPCTELGVYDSNVIGLSDLKRLYYNGNLYSSKATSFFIIPPFLLVTTSEHTLLLYKFSNSECNLISTRRLERGSKIITVVNDNIVLQMPRGNLETIQPRALTLHTAASLINKCDYKTVFTLLRKHRINMNLIVDHQPQTFLLTVTKFVQQVNDPLDLSLFLSELADVDVTRGLYKDSYIQDDRPPLLDKKIDRVCQALRGVMMTTGSDDTHFLNPIITTYVKTNDMNEALKLASQSNSCLKHLLFLVDVDRLYICALGLYNLEMALRIAEKSKKDPKEYVPYLNNLKRLDEEYMKFIIDCEFNKFESALRNISQSNNEVYFQKALELIESKNLYPLALQLYKPFPERYDQVCLLFAEHLMSKHSYEEAALLFTRCGMLDKALNAYADAGLWRNAVMMAKRLEYGYEEILALGRRILQVLIRKGLCSEAASLSEEILRDENLVIEFLVQGKLWDKAFYYTSTSSNAHMEAAIMPYVREEAVAISEILKENVEKLKKHSARLTEVRLQKLKKKENQVSDIDISDIKSDISSVSGGFSSNTSRTGGTQSTKNTRKMQKKMWSLKEGNPREEFALLSVITQLVQDVERLTDDVSRSCSALLYFNDNDFDNLALNLQTSMKQALQTVVEIKSSVWPTQAIDNDMVAANELQDAQLKFPPSSCMRPSWNLKVLDA